MGEDIEWTPGKLLETSGLYWQSCLVHAGVKLDLFSHIGDRALGAEELMEKMACDSRAITMLLNAFAAIGLLIKKGRLYSNTVFGKSFLVKNTQHYMGYMVKHHHHLVNSWSRLDEAVLSGEPVRKEGFRDEEEIESFLMGMFNNAMGIAPNLAQQIDLTGNKHLLDLGGGPGTYAIHFCLETPGLRATIYDLPSTKPFALKTIEKFGLMDRIDFQVGDYVKEDLKGKYDVIWLSHILHSEGPEICKKIIDKAVSSLVPGGLVLIHDFILDETMAGPIFPALFSLNMLVNTKNGQSYSGGQIESMMIQAGLTNITRLSFQGPNFSGIISGTS